MMKLYVSPPSPFARKALVTARETGLMDRIEPIWVTVSPVNRDDGVAANNPLGRIPTLVLEDGTALFDSRVICEWMDRHTGAGLLPAADPDRGRIQTLAALADGLLDSAVLARYEMALRPADRQWPDWLDGHMVKVNAALDDLETRWLDDLNGPLTLGTIALGCALGYLDLRFADLGWRASHPGLDRWFTDYNARPAMAATMPSA